MVATVCAFLLLLFMTSKAESNCKIKEVKVWQSGAGEVDVQLRTDDGRPAKFRLMLESGAMVFDEPVIHSKITTIRGLSKGTYIYHCESADGDNIKGKTIVK